MTMTKEKKLLRLVYKKHGPREVVGLREGVRLVPPKKFAAMTKQQVNQWDFDDRDLMLAIAKVLSA